MSAEALEMIARKFNCMDIDELSDLEADIVMILTAEGYLEQENVYDEEGNLLYSELAVVPLKK